MAAAASAAGLKLAVGAATSRIALLKCLVAADVVGLDVVAVPAARCALVLPQRLPALVHGQVQVFGEHAILRYLGAAGGRKRRLEDSLEGSDWVEFDERVLMSKDLQLSDVAAVEARFAKDPRAGSGAAATSASLGGVSGALGVADVCLGCTLALARESGMPLGPRAAGWLAQLMAAHPEFYAGLLQSRTLAAQLCFDFVAARDSQAAGVSRVLTQATMQVLAKIAPAGVEPEPMVGEGNKAQAGKGKLPAEFQINNAMSLYKAMQVAGAAGQFKSPRDVGVAIAETAKKTLPHLFGERGMISEVEVGGPGFVNLYLSEAFVSGRVQRMLEDGGLKPMHADKRKVGCDFSSPNVAKEMHVGHLRSTIIGEVICRMLSFCGSDVKRINHIGDWGTQFGMLLTYMRHEHPDFLKHPPSISDLDSFYKKAKKASDASTEFAEEARLEVVKLQSGDPAAIAAWRQFLDISEQALNGVYRRLGVTFPDGLCGESFYNDKIPAIVKELNEKKMVKIEDGAQCIFTSQSPPPLFLVKRDGGVGYDSTDLAAVRWRTHQLGLDWVIYVVDAGQSQHFEQIFEASRTAGWLRGSTRLDHVKFGVVCGQDGKRFRTRDGGTTRLVDLLDEAKNRMAADMRARIAEGRTPLTEADVEHCSSVLGYSAVKYFDLKNSREKDYIFDYDQMLASDGDTAVYLIYSYARICSIEAKAAQVLGGSADATVQMALKQGKLRVSRDRPAEWQLALALIKFPDNLEHAVQELRPHHLCAYVYELAVAFAKFYSTHQLLVPNPTDASQRMLDPQHGMAWLALLRAVKVALKDSLALLSIDTLERI